MTPSETLWRYSEQYRFWYSVFLSIGDAEALSHFLQSNIYRTDIQWKKDHVAKCLSSCLRKNGVQKVSHRVLRVVTVSKKRLQGWLNTSSMPLSVIISVIALKTVIYATVLHHSSTDQNSSHSISQLGASISGCCLETSNTAHTRTTLEFLLHKIFPKIMPLYQKLGIDNIMDRSLLGETQC
jgi:hypothetical protein